MELHCGKNPWRKFSVATRAVSLLTAGGPASRAAHALPTQTQNTPTPHHTHTKTPPNAYTSLSRPCRPNDMFLLLLCDW